MYEWAWKRADPDHPLEQRPEQEQPHGPDQDVTATRPRPAQPSPQVTQGHIRARRMTGSWRTLARPRRPVYPR